ncbi:MAG: hypothetical protein ACTSPB_23645 [Candidatus Thorarchaeota archaeon]
MHSAVLKGEELTYTTAKKLQPGDVLLMFWTGKVWKDDNPNAYHSGHVTSIDVQDDRVIIYFRPLYMNDREVPIGREYLSSGTGCVSLSKEPVAFPHRLFLLGHINLVNRKPFSPAPGNTAYDLMC